MQGTDREGGPYNSSSFRLYPRVLEGAGALEAELLERLAAGDRLALARVTRMTTGCLRRLGAYELGDEHQDLCQEVVWALVRAVREGRAPVDRAVSSYVASVVHNQFITWLRKRTTRPTESLQREDGSLLEPPADDPRGSGPDSLPADERYAARQALSCLPREWQSLLIAHYVEGCTIDTLVSVNGTSRATLNRELKRARDAFRDHLLGDDTSHGSRKRPPAGSTSRRQGTGAE